MRETALRGSAVSWNARTTLRPCANTRTHTKHTHTQKRSQNNQLSISIFWGCRQNLCMCVCVCSLEMNVEILSKQIQTPRRTRCVCLKVVCLFFVATVQYDGYFFIAACAKYVGWSVLRNWRGFPLRKPKERKSKKKNGESSHRQPNCRVLRVCDRWSACWSDRATHRIESEHAFKPPHPSIPCKQRFKAIKGADQRTHQRVM